MIANIYTFSLAVFTGFFAIVNPIANIPIFISLVQNEDQPSRKKIARTAAFTAFVIVAVFVILGKYIFQLFGITIPAFKVTGGILLFYVGFEMLMSRKSKVHTSENVDPTEGVAISPLAIPILAGPGTIVTAMNNVTDGSLLHIGIVIGLLALILYLNYQAFVLSDLIVGKIGNNLIEVVGKLMGLILAIIGTGMVMEGIKLAFGL